MSTPVFNFQLDDDELEQEEQITGQTASTGTSTKTMSNTSSSSGTSTSTSASGSSTEFRGHTSLPPIRWMTQSCPRACGLAFVIMLLPLLFAVLTIPTLKFDEEGEGDNDPNDPRTLTWLLINQVQEWGAEQAEELASDDTEIGRQELPGLFLINVYFSEEGNLLTKSAIARIKEFEDRLLNDDRYEDFCLRSGGECVPDYVAFSSLTNYFYSSTLNLAPTNESSGFFGDRGSKKMQDFDAVLDLLLLLTEDPAASQRVFFGKGFGKKGNDESPVTRSTYIFGQPLKGYKSEDDRWREQDYKFADWVTPFINEFENDDELEMLYIGSGITLKVFFSTLYKDMSLAILSFLFIGGYIVFHTKSAFISIMGLIHIVMSFPSSLFAYSYIFQIDLFFGLNALAIYIILAIGADDIFVFMDAYSLSRAESSLKGAPFDIRLTWVYKRAAKAMLITSLTTSAAFMATATSPLPTVAAFGLFTAMLIIFNYGFVITYFPCIVTVYHMWYEHTTRTCCCCPCEAAKPLPPPDEGDGGAAGRNPDSDDESSGPPVKITAAYADGDDDGSGSSDGGSGGGKAVSSTEGMNVEDMDALQRFFHVTYSDAINQGRVQIGLLLFFLVLFGVTVAFAVQVSPATRTQQFLPKNHPIQRWVTVQNEEFISNAEDDQVEVTLLFGAERLDRDGVGKFEFDNKGKIIWEKDFDITSTETQQHLYDTCQNAREDGDLVRLEQHQCPMIGFKEWIESDDSAAVRWTLGVADGTVNPNSSSIGPGVFPVDPDDFKLLMSLWFYAAGPPDAPFNAIASPFDAAFNAIRYNNNMGFHGKVQPLVPWISLAPPFYPWAYYDEAPLTPANVTSLAGLVAAARAGSDGVEIRYMSAKFNTTLKDAFTPYFVIEPYFEDWQGYIDDANSAAKKAGIKGVAAHQGSFEWVFSVTQRIYVTSAVTGGAVSIALAFVILLLSTGNIVISAMAIASICGVVACLLGIMVMVGWELGTIESISATVLVGLAVDYVVHLANAYMEASSTSRADRVRDAATEMGFTVVGGAITSVGASLILFATTIQFFFKFGFFMCLTCFFSIVWALGFFMPLLAAVGPEGDFGQLLWRKDGIIWIPGRSSNSSSEDDGVDMKVAEAEEGKAGVSGSESDSSSGD